MSRSLKKGPYVHYKLLKQVERAVAESSRKPLKTKKRASCILPNMVGLTIAVYNGRIYVPVLIVEDMIGHRLGEFSITRVIPKHVGDKKS
jgi:small subunit ribosomal protein S19